MRLKINGNWFRKWAAQWKNGYDGRKLSHYYDMIESIDSSWNIRIQMELSFLVQ